jgi:hypothetical protein
VAGKKPNLPEGKDTKAGKKRKSTTGGRGPRNVNQATWRRKMQESRLKFDDDAKQRFLDDFAEHGLMWHAANAAGVHVTTVGGHLDNDPEFMQAFQEAKAQYADNIVAHHRRLCLKGVEEPIVGGPDKDEVIAHKVTYPTNLIAMELKRMEPEYKDKTEVDMTVNGGVLVAPSQMTPAEWTEKFAKKRGEDEAEEQAQ